MADSDKDILITPKTGAATDPSIVFSSGATGGDDVTLFVTDDGTITTLSIEGSAGQLLAISNDLTGTIFSVNDVSGIPSIEVDADGTISLAEFDGEVGIGTSAPAHLLHLEGRSPINTAAGIFIDSTGDAYLDLRADNTTGGAETNNPYVRFRQDQDVVETVIGHNDNANDSLGNAVTGASSNSFVIHNQFATGTIELAVNGAVGLRVDDSNNVTVTNDIYPGGQTSGRIAAVTGQYGAIQIEGIDGSSGTYGGVSLDGNFVLMNSGAAHVGLYDDVNNDWMILAYPLSYVRLHHSGNNKLETTASGVSVTGTMAATTVTGANVTSGADPGHTHTSASITSVSAANISAGNLGSGVLPYATASSTASNFKIPFLNTTGTTSGNFGLLHDTDATFYYNPSSNTFTVPTGVFTNATVSGGNLTLSSSANIVSTVNENNGIEAGYLGINSTTGSDGHGLSLYNGYQDGEPTYGMFFGQTATFGSYGNASGDWNTYLTMNSTANRGWAFKVSAGSVVASIENTGYANFPRYYVGSSTTHYMAPVTGQYGSVAVFGENTSYRGYAVGAGDIVLMSNGTTHGIFDDVNNDWWMQFAENAGVKLYYNGTIMAQTVTGGLNVGPGLFINEFSTAGADVAGDGQIWVKSNVPNDLYFTNDVGVDYPVGYATYRRSAATTIDNINQTLNMTTDSVADAMVGGAWIKTNTTAYTLTLEPSTDTQFPVGSQISLYNRGASGNMTVTEGSGTTLYVLTGSGTTDAAGSATVGPGGYATIIRESTTIYVMMGAGITP